MQTTKGLQKMQTTKGLQKMQTPRGLQLLTCRYWAFGPRCPDIDVNGVSTCPYAHWDTGRLSNFYRQRGTCWYWAHPRLNCNWGAICHYEHRDTGYTGVHHGMLELSGLNLQIADAASESGFDTRNHVALLDLIWSVRRVALSYVTSPRSLPPPKPPIYPDRYRPGAQGKSSKKSRKRARDAEARAHAKDVEAHVDGTANNPIDLDTEGSTHDEEQITSRSSKRQQIAFGVPSNPTPTPVATGPSNPVHPSRFPNSRLNQVKSKDKEDIAPARTTYMPSPASLNLPAPRDSPSVPRLEPLALVPANSARHHVPFRPRDPIQDTGRQRGSFDELRRVSRILSENLNAIYDCQKVMRTLFDEDEQMRRSDMFDLLVKLRDDMEDSEKGTLKSVAGVDGVVAFLTSHGRDSAMDMDEID